MKAVTQLLLVGSITLMALSGCGGHHAERPKADAAKAPAADSGHDSDETKIQANLAKLDAEDRKLAEAQQFCAIETKNRLGSMGAPYKLMLMDQPVLLCCDGCETRAKAHADRTLAKVQQLKEKNAASSAK